MINFIYRTDTIIDYEMVPVVLKIPLKHHILGIECNGYNELIYCSINVDFSFHSVPENA